MVALKTDPWHGQAKTSFVPSNCTVQPAWGQTAEKARNSPLFTWTTRAGTCRAGSVKVAAPPTGTSAAGPIWVPLGPGMVAVVVGAAGLVVLPVAAGAYPLVAGEALLGAPVSGSDAAAPEGWALCRNRPRALTSPLRVKPASRDNARGSGFLQEGPPSELCRLLLRRRQLSLRHSPPRRGRTQRRSCSFGPAGENAVEREGPRASKHERRPGKQEHNVSSVVVRVVPEADRKEERQREQRSSGGRHTPEQPYQGAKADSDLPECDQDGDDDGCMEGGVEEVVKGARDYGPPELLLERAWGSRAKEVGVGEFLQPGEAERYPEKGPEEQQRPSRCGQGP